MKKILISLLIIIVVIIVWLGASSIIRKLSISCGGFAGEICSPGLTCVYNEGDYRPGPGPDASGKCVLIIDPFRLLIKELPI